MNSCFYVGPFEFQLNAEYNFLSRSDVKQKELYQRGQSQLLKKIQVDAERVLNLSKPPDSHKVLEKNWRIWKKDESWILQFWSELIPDYAIEAIFDNSHERIKISVLRDHPLAARWPFLLTNVLRWFCALVAVEEGGFLIHSAAILIANNEVFLGIGSSGAGKSTLSRLCLGRHEVLSDETVLVLAKENGFYAFGTPWAGMLNRAINAGGKIKKIFLLEKSPVNRWGEVHSEKAYLTIFPEIFLPPFDEEVSTKALSNLEKCLIENRAEILQFRKDPSIAVFLENRSEREIKV